jgi:hypothetical protein
VNSKQRATLAQIFAVPTPRDIPWTDIESLIRALGGEVISRKSGSRVGFVLGAFHASFHSPHPERHTGIKTTQAVRDFLVQAGIAL